MYIQCSVFSVQFIRPTSSQSDSVTVLVRERASRWAGTSCPLFTLLSSTSALVGRLVQCSATATEIENVSACELLPGCLATTTTQSLSVTVECRSESTKNANLLSLPALALAAVPWKQGELEKRRGARLTTRLLLFLLLLIGPAISALRALVSETGGKRAVAVAVALAEIEAEPQVAHRVVRVKRESKGREKCNKKCHSGM